MKDSRSIREVVIVPHPDQTKVVPRITAPAKVKWRIKGSPDGPVYQGQAIVVPCPACRGGK
jgi:hypothetical protein